MKWRISGKKLLFPAIFFLIFISVAVWRYLATGKVFYLLNFGYIGFAVALGIFLFDTLPKKHILWGRRISQLLIGLYLLGYVGFIRGENMQIEGFFAYLMAGIFAGATLHYLIAKVAGPVLFGRGWCGWACWTAMVLDLLPWREPSKNRPKKAWGVIRYIHFFAALGLVLFFFFGPGLGELYSNARTEIIWLAAGNGLYYLIAITLAVTLKDNRAFCKYVCPIPAMQKVTSRFSLMKIKIDPVTCTECGLCEKKCPMNVPLLLYKKQGMRITSTECIFCQTCTQVCPAGAAKTTFGLDMKQLRPPRDEDG